MQPVRVNSEPDDLNGREPLWRVWGGIAQRSQFARRHENLDVMVREIQELCGICDVEARRKIPGDPGGYCRLMSVRFHRFCSEGPCRGPANLRLGPLLGGRANREEARGSGAIGRKSVRPALDSGVIAMTLCAAAYGGANVVPIEM